MTLTNLGTHSLKGYTNGLRSICRSITSNSSQDYDDYPFLRHCEKETSEPVSGTLKGSIPQWLQGDLIRNGPGIQKIGNDQYSHIFDGLSVLHKFSIKDGKATYQSRALRSDAYTKNMAANRIVVSEFGTKSFPDPCQGLFGRFKTIFQKTSPKPEITDNCNVNVAYYGDQLYAMTETNFTRRVDPSSLDTVGEKINISDYVAINSATAHPHVLEDGTIINVGNNYRHSKGPHYCFIKVPPSYNSEKTSFANTKLIAEIPSRWKMFTAYFHSFGITASGKLIFVEYPYCLNLMGMVAGGFLDKSYKDWMKWYPKEKTLIHVIDMKTGKPHPVRYETDQLFLFHHINAYEENGEIILDVAGYNDAEWVGHITVEDTRKPANISEQGSGRRYVLPLNVDSAKPGENLGKVLTTATATLRKDTSAVVDLTPQHLTKEVVELPRINYKYNGKNYKYFYGLQQTKPLESHELVMDVISKVNVKTGETKCWTGDKDTRASEPIFVADPTNRDAEEDDGVVLAALLPNHKPTNVSLLILNAKDMTEIGRTDFTALGNVTGTFHGEWAQEGERVHSF